MKIPKLLKITILLKFDCHIFKYIAKIHLQVKLYSARIPASFYNSSLTCLLNINALPLKKKKVVLHCWYYVAASLL